MIYGGKQKRLMVKAGKRFRRVDAGAPARRGVGGARAGRGGRVVKRTALKLGRRARPDLVRRMPKVAIGPSPVMPQESVPAPAPNIVSGAVEESTGE